MDSDPEPGVDRVRFESFELDLKSGELWRDGAAVDLPPQPARVLSILVTRAGSLVDRARLRREVWGEAWLDWESGLHQAVRKIRVALGDSASDPRFIETLPRRGYRFVATVESSMARPSIDREAPPVTTHRSSAPHRSKLRMLVTVAPLTALLLSLLIVTPDARPPTSEPALEARRLHAEARFLLERGAIPEALEKLERAVSAAPSWGALWSTIAEAELARPDEGRVARARLALERALARNPEDARSWRLLARLLMWEEWDWTGAHGALARALEIAPDHAEAWQLLAGLETVVGQHGDALDAARTAVVLDPVSTARRVVIGWTLYYQGRVDEALAECRRSLDLEPRSSWAKQCVVQSFLALGRDAEAEALLADGRAAPDVGGVARYFERQLVRLAEESTCASSAAAAVPKIVLGDREGALDALAEGARERRSWELPFALHDPLLVSLKGRPGFERVIRAVGASRLIPRRPSTAPSRGRLPRRW